MAFQPLEGTVQLCSIRSCDDRKSLPLGLFGRLYPNYSNSFGDSPLFDGLDTMLVLNMTYFMGKYCCKLSFIVATTKHAAGHKNEPGRCCKRIYIVSIKDQQVIAVKSLRKV